MIHVQFTAADLARTRLTATAGPVSETVMALGVATGLRPRTIAGGWAQSARRRAGRPERELAGLLHPRRHATLDLFTLSGRSGSIQDGTARLGHADRDHVATEVRAVWGVSGSPFVGGLRDGERPAIARLAAAVEAAFRRLVEPYWPAFGQLAEAHRVRLERTMAAGGVAAVLEGLGGGTRWDGETLHLPGAGLWSDGPVTCSLHGRGLVLAPSVLAEEPVPWFPLDESQPAVLLCPVSNPSATEGVGRSSADGLDRLVGRTRARIIRQVAESQRGRSTSEVSRDAAISAATASEHLTVLRDAGLVHSTRRGQRVVHTVSPLGRRLLDG